MSTSFSYWLSNKEKTSRKSAGCMTGIFQLCACKFLLSPREPNGQYHKTIPSAGAIISLCKQGADYREVCNLEQNQRKSYQENSRSSMESSTRTSFSSSSTSFSSIKHSLPKDGTKSSEQSFSSGTSPRNSTNQRSTDSNQSSGFRDRFKESIFKDLKNVSIKKKIYQGVKKNKVLIPVDSPRPIDLSKMKELEESLKILIQLGELPKNFNEVGCSPRFSYDGKISTPIKQTITQKEHRRLSLDSVEDSLRCDFNSQVNSLMKELEKKTNYSASKSSNLLHQDLRSNENHTNIVAKLMGLGPINSARESLVKGHETVSKQKKQESKHGMLLQSTCNSTNSRSCINPQMKYNSNSRLVVECAQQKMAVECDEGNRKQKIESAYNLIEKTLQKLEFHHNIKEIRDLRRAILESKNSAKSLSKSEKISISGRTLKSPSLVMKPDSKSAGVSFPHCARLEEPSDLRKIKTSYLGDRKKESLSADKEQTPTGNTSKRLISSAKETSRRAGDNSVSPRLQKWKLDQERKSCTVNQSLELKNKRQTDNWQQLESMSPSSRFRQKSSKAQLNEGKPHLIHQTKRKTATNAASASKQKQNHMIQGKVLFVEELEKIDTQLSSPNSVLNASPYHDDLPLSPLSISSISNAEDENLHSDHNLRTTCLSKNLPSILSFEKDSQQLENIDANAHEFIFPGSAIDNNDPDSKYVAEVILSSTSLLTNDSQLPVTLKQIKVAEPFDAVENSNAEILHKQLVYDVVNEILTRKIESFKSGCQRDHILESNMLRLQLFKELCSEVKYLKSSTDGRVQGKDTVFTKDLLRRSNAWDRFDSEVPALVLEIENLIFGDLINESASSFIDVNPETKRRYRRQLFV